MILQKKFSKLIAILIVLCIIMLLLLGCVKKGIVLVIEDELSGIRKTFYLKDKKFILSYTHSVHLTNFEEHFIVTEDNKMLLQKNVFDSFGVGSPVIEDYSKFKLENNKFVYYIDRIFDEINMVISPIPKHKLTIGESEIDIIGLLNENTKAIKIYILEKYIIVFGNNYIISF